MSLNTIDAKVFAKMFLAGAKNLESKKEWINELNVFPVPDGDTGTNMTLTIMSAAKEVAAMKEPDMMTLAKAISSGSLRGARGNSGVILSQLFRGFTKGIRENEEITIPILAAAGEKAVETAYKAVMKPKEGTILTVAKGASMKARELADAGETDMASFIKEVIAHAEYVLSQTPEMLPVLKQAGVVDSGGQGLIEVLHGAYDAFMGKEIDFSITEPAQGASRQASVNASLDVQANMEIKFGYCTEFIIMLSKTFNIKQEMDFKAYLESIGDSIVVVADEDVVKVHVHTNDPGLAIQKALKYGALSNLKIDNMRLEHQEKLFRMSEDAADTPDAAKEEEVPAERKETGFIAVSVGEGIDEIFKGLGVDYIIAGGQTMNPSTDDILNAIQATPAQTVFVLPNNKNIIMASEQAQKLADRKVIVLPTRTVPQGMTAMLNFDPEAAPEENAVNMMAAAEKVATGLITYAARDSEFDGRPIRKGEIMALENGKIVATGSDITKMTYRLARSMKKKDSQFITVISGAEVSEEDAEHTTELVQSKCGSSVEVSHIHGGQPVYYYMLSVE